MVKGMASPILVMVALVFLGGWSARAEPPIALRADEITEEESSGTHEHNSDTHQHDADAHQHDSDTGEHMTGAEGKGSHSEEMVGHMGDESVEHPRVHEAGAMGEHEGMMGGGKAGNPAGGMHSDH